MADLTMTRREVENGEFPHLCLECGEPAATEVIKSFAWHPSWVYLLILLTGVLPYVILAMILTKKMTMAAPLCLKHKNHWTKITIFVLGGLLTIAGGITGVCYLLNALGHDGESWSGFVILGGGMLTLLFIIVAVAKSQRCVRPLEITDRTISLTNLSPAFVEAMLVQQEEYAHEHQRHVRTSWKEDAADIPVVRPLRNDDDENYRPGRV